ncbi:hypothetical protein LEMLEM_LOCUS26183, partial [Lemmus lemmus]
MMHDVKDTHLQPDKSVTSQNHIFCSRAGFMSLHHYRGAQFFGWNGRPYGSADDPTLPILQTQTVSYVLRALLRLLSTKQM